MPQTAFNRAVAYGGGGLDVKVEREWRAGRGRREVDDRQRPSTTVDPSASLWVTARQAFVRISGLFSVSRFH